MVRVYYYILFLILFSTGIYSQEIKVSASVDSTDYLIGDFIKFKIKIEHPDTINVAIPSFKDSIKQIEFIEELEAVSIKNNNKLETTYEYILAMYDSGDVVIPSLPVIYLGTIDKTPKLEVTTPVTFTVHTLTVDLAEDIKDVKDPSTIPIDWKEVLIWVLIIYSILGFLLTLFLFIRDYLRKKEVKPEEEKKLYIPLHIRTLSELDELNKKQLWQNGFIKEYHTEITGILRNYFEERFKFPALELTSTETLNELIKYSSANSIIETTKDFFENADLVKFAKYIPMNEINETMMKQALNIVEKTSELNKEENIEVNSNETENVNV